MMLFGGKIVVTIGYSGTVIAFHNNGAITNKFFFEKHDDEALNNIIGFFKAKKRHKIHILLDTIDQTYKKKYYPSVRRMDLKNLTRRDLGGVSNKDNIRDFVVQDLVKEKKRDGKIIKKWDVLLVTASINEEITKWLDFLTNLPNQIEGIYTIPVETFSIAKKLSKRDRILKEQEKLAKKASKDKKNKKKIKNKIIPPRHNIYCLIIYTKANGFRQIIFSEKGTVFTRIINYDTQNSDFVKNYEHDIYSTYEYLKRTFLDIKMSDIEVINILPKNLLDKVKDVSNHNHELNFVNYTPCDAALSLNLKPGIITKNTEFGDLLISRCFYKFKKSLRFRTPKISTSNKMYGAMKGSYYFNLFLSIFFFVELLSNVHIRVDHEKEITKAEVKKFKATEELHKIQNKVLNITNESGKTVNIEKAVEIGKISEVLGTKSDFIFNKYNELGYLSKYNVVLSRITFSASNFDHVNPNKNSKYSGNFSGIIYNKTGNIDDLFSEFDNLSNDGAKSVKDVQMRFSKLPRDIDFNKKYFDFPISFTITSK